MKRTFQLTNLDSNNNKFWEFEENGSQVTFYWGRVGTKGEQVTKSMSSRQLDSKIREKLEKGYVEVFKGTTAPIATVANPFSGAVAKYVDAIFAAANDNIKSYLKVSINELSPEQIAQGRKQLNFVSGLWDLYGSSKSKSSGEQLKKAVEAYYNIIPTKLPHRIDPEQIVLNFCKDFSEQENRLEQLAAATQVSPVTSEINFGADLELLPQSSPEFDRLVRWMKATDRGHCRLVIKDILKARLPLERAAYEQCTLTNIQELFHGTKAQYVRHILGTKNAQGLIVPQHRPNGRAFGNGIYLANVSTKSAQYCDPYAGLGFLLIVNTKLGKVYVPAAGGDSNMKPPAGYDSIHAVAGRTRKNWGTLDNDEFVVYNKNQQTIEYVIVLDKPY